MAVARQNHTQQVHYIRANVAFNTANIANGVNFGAVPAGARIVDIVVVVDTAFNAATTNVLTIGTTATGTNVASSTDTAAGTAGVKRITTGATLSFASDTDLFMRYTQTGTAATAGAAFIYIGYVPNNDVF